MSRMTGGSMDRNAKPDVFLPGRSRAMPVPERHMVLGTPMAPPFPAGAKRILFGMGCFWGAERLFWSQPGVLTTAVGYAGGRTPNPTYDEVCSGSTGHAEVVLVVFDPVRIPLSALLRLFWQEHDPTQGLRQGNDWGPQYRSLVGTSDAAALSLIRASLNEYRQALDLAGFGQITTEVVEDDAFYYAEAVHQQYLAKNPGGYCGLAGTGVSCSWTATDKHASR